MTEIYRLRSTWTGFVGSPGVSTMFFLDVATAVASVHTFWTVVAAKLPSDVHIQVENTGDILEDTTGELTGAWSAASVASIGGAMSDPYSAPSGAVVDWLTETITAGHRLRGRTFVVPLGGPTYQADGSLAAATITLIQGAADDLIASQSASFVIWHRGTGSDGSNGLVTAARVPDLAAVLRSRRD
jgi:hypothetical protein